jgi:uncharacterized protein (DUF433 family)
VELEHYFEFVDGGAIRIAGTRVPLENIVRAYDQGASPEEIVLRYPALSLEQVHAAITYYLARRTQVEAYVARVRQRDTDAWDRQQHQPSEFVRALRSRLDAQRRVLDGAVPSPSPAAAR